jgi:RNA polymerase sigma-70 factor, ECF subfamily
MPANWFHDSRPPPEGIEKPRPDDTTQSLIDAAREGDETAWSELHVRYRRILALLVRSSRPSSLKGRVGTEDIVQSAFLSAFRGLNGYEDRGPGSFLSWLKKILQNRIAERLRQHQAEKRDARRDEPLDGGRTPSSAADPSPSEIASHAEACSMLLAAIAELPTDLRDVIICHFFEDLSTRRIAEVLETSETSVRRRIAATLGILKKRLEDHERVPEPTPPEAP